MHITEVRIKLMEEPGERLRAFCSITFDDCFVVRDLKIIEGASGLFVAMPSRKLTAHCSKCGMKNHLRASYCNQCGARLGESRLIKDSDGRTKLYADIAHPINSACREMIQTRVVDEYHHEVELAKSPDYVSRYDEYDAGDYTDTDESPPEAIRRIDSAHQRPAASKPHHPPQGDPSRGASIRPETAPTGSTKGAASPEETPHSGGSNGGFGAGIF
ncbi:SpoVG family protein [Botrimarina sp.]|uniref:SpoVG family protein n=1 Tax=Botrimarina sp. TaxID=2795802 RepID=UPI0032EE950C